MGGHSTNGSSAPTPDPTPVGPGRGGDPGHADRDAHPYLAVATSPAVGVFQPRPDARPGARVRNGDRIGAVDMLGVPQEVVAPADGVVSEVLVERGDAVEFGQDLIVIERTGGGAS
jgi:biotin carboxyl carrier protein